MPLTVLSTCSHHFDSAYTTDFGVHMYIKLPAWLAHILRKKLTNKMQQWKDIVQFEYFLEICKYGTIQFIFKHRNF